MESPISGAEWQVMRVLWAHPGTTSQFIIRGLQDGFDWQPATIKTLLGRLRKKNYLRMEKEGGKYHYWPLMSEAEHLSLQLQTILNNSCSRKNGNLLVSLLELGTYSQSDLKMIQHLLAEHLTHAPESIECHCLPGQCTCGHHH